MNDLRFAFRQLLKNPGFTAVAVLTLAICLAANLTILAVVDAILWRKLPFAKPERLAILFNSYPGAGADRVSGSLPNYFDRRGAIQAFESVAIFQESSVIVGATDRPQRLPILRISPEFFATLGVPLALGQPFAEENLAYRADEVAIVTDEFWRRQFNADPNVIGRTFPNDGATISVVGVLPRGFRFLSSRAQFFRPASHAPADRAPSSRHGGDWSMIARLAPGMTWGEAQSQMNAFNARQAEDDPIKETIQKAGFHTVVRSLREDHVQQVKPMLVLLQTGVVFLLLMGVVNLANLLLIRAHGRAQELTVRRALGAGQWLLARAALVEVMVLVWNAGLAGLVLAAVGMRLLTILGAEQLPLGATIQFDARTAAAGLAAAIVVGFALAALQISFTLRMKLAPGLKLAPRGGTVGHGAQRWHHGFVVVQVALAFLLLSGAGLLGVSLKRVLETPVGFRTANVLTGQITFPWSSYTNQPSRIAFVERLLRTVRALPGVTQVAVNNSLPFAGEANEFAIAVEGQIPEVRSHHVYYVTDEYWGAMGIPLMRGRLLEAADRHREPRACLVDQAFAERYWPGADPLGRRLTIGATFTGGESSTVVGVVASVKHQDVVEEAGHGGIYLPYGESWPSAFTLVVRSAVPLATSAAMIRQAVSSCDPGMPIEALQPLQTYLDDKLIMRRSPAILAGVFAGVALLLASLGTYGVLAYAVSQRQREIGVRMALGAQPGQVLAQFFRIGAKLCLVGLALGVMGAWFAGRAMQSLLFGVGVLPPGIVLLASLVLAAVVGLASLIPSRRAARVDPMVALRNE